MNTFLRFLLTHPASLVAAALTAVYWASLRDGIINPQVFMGLSSFEWQMAFVLIYVVNGLMAIWITSPWSFRHGLVWLACLPVLTVVLETTSMSFRAFSDSRGYQSIAESLMPMAIRFAGNAAMAILVLGIVRAALPDVPRYQGIFRWPRFRVTYLLTAMLLVTAISVLAVQRGFHESIWLASYEWPHVPLLSGTTTGLLAGFVHREHLRWWHCLLGLAATAVTIPLWMWVPLPYSSLILMGCIHAAILTGWIIAWRIDRCVAHRFGNAPAAPLPQ